MYIYDIVQKERSWLTHENMLAHSCSTELPHFILPPDGQRCHSSTMFIADRRSVRPSSSQVNANCTHNKRAHTNYSREKYAGHMTTLYCIINPYRMRYGMYNIKAGEEPR